MSNITWEKITDLNHPAQIQEELTKRYKDTWVKITIRGNSMYGKYRGINESGQFTFRTLEDMRIELGYDTEADITIEQPDIGLYNTKDNVIMVTALPHRQWKRGICDKNTSACTLLSYAQNKNYNNELNQRINFILKPQPLADTLSYAQHVLQDGNRYAIAITREFGLVQNFTSEKQIQLLFYYHINIGYVENNTVYVTKPEFKQEVLDNQTIFNGYEIKHV